MQVVQEFMNLPVINVPMNSAPEMAVDQGAEMGVAQDGAVDGGAAVTQVPPVYVYADTITSGGECGNISCFDIVFQVNTTMADGTVKSCKIIKRIGVDRARIFDECQDKMTVLEQKVSNDAKRARRLAGLE